MYVCNLVQLCQARTRPTCVIAFVPNLKERKLSTVVSDNQNRLANREGPTLPAIHSPELSYVLLTEEDDRERSQVFPNVTDTSGTFSLGQDPAQQKPSAGCAASWEDEPLLSLPLSRMWVVPRPPKCLETTARVCSIPYSL